MLRHLLHTVERLVDFLVALEAEGDGDDANSEDAQVFRLTGNDGRCSSACSSTHTGRDKGHASAVVEHVAYVFDAFLSGLTGPFGFVAGSQSLFSQLQMNGHGAVVEGLVIGIAEHESDIVDAFAVHVVDGIASTATYANDLDDAFLFFGLTEV